MLFLYYFISFSSYYCKSLFILTRLLETVSGCLFASTLLMRTFRYSITWVTRTDQPRASYGTGWKWAQCPPSPRLPHSCKKTRGGGVTGTAPVTPSWSPKHNRLVKKTPFLTLNRRLEVNSGAQIREMGGVCPRACVWRGRGGGGSPWVMKLTYFCLVTTFLPKVTTHAYDLAPAAENGRSVETNGRSNPRFWWQHGQWASKQCTDSICVPMATPSQMARETINSMSACRELHLVYLTGTVFGGNLNDW